MILECYDVSMFNMWLGKGKNKEKEKPKVYEKSRLDMKTSLEIIIGLVAVALFIAGMSWIVN